MQCSATYHEAIISGVTSSSHNHFAPNPGSIRSNMPWGMWCRVDQKIGFRGDFCRHLQRKRTRSCETSRRIYQIARCHIPGGSNLHNHCRENIRSRYVMSQFILCWLMNSITLIPIKVIRRNVLRNNFTMCSLYIFCYILLHVSALVGHLQAEK
jgi:hypothetical protein